MRAFLQKLPYSALIIFALTLGLAPFVPQPHIWEKLNMLISGELTKAIDIFDFLFHGSPWILLALKLALSNSDDE